MAANLKSHVLRRDEKGFMGIPFKRLLFAGVGGGMVLIITRFAVGNLAFVLAFVAFIAALALTGPRGGIPLWQRLLYRLRGSLMLAALGLGLLAIPTPSLTVSFAGTLAVVVAFAALRRRGSTILQKP